MTTYMSTDALARMLDMTPEHVRDKLSKMHGFPSAIRVGGVLRWKAEEVEEWLESRRVSPAARRSKSRSRGNTSSTRRGSDGRSSAQAPAVADATPAA